MQEHALFHLTYWITALVTFSKLPVASALAMPLESISPNQQYMSRLRASTPANTLLDAPQVAADI